MVEELLEKYRQLTSSQKLFFELLAFVYIGSRNGKGIAIEAQTIKKSLTEKLSINMFIRSLLMRRITSE
ncbi:hypothetical protein NWO28_11710 [Enterococcus faecalis]|uniref:hypothetical protein n=1 Tax=Enterococcus faecalis TaxID=1351 RepID=UPI001CE605B9|nr:hypothetical protein [Enterococcus faecalis]MCS5459273.1 hypothetical protein [Enterococcus faecalis]CAG9069433.1 Uncharacterised protein [Enterococcus faecalis]